MRFLYLLMFAEIILAQNPKDRSSLSLTSKPAMAQVKGGSFMMGSAKGQTNERLHPAEVSDFEIGVYELTYAEFDHFLKAANYHYQPNSSFGHGGRGHYPASYISWYDAIAYCNWLSEQQGYDSCYIYEGEIYGNTNIIWNKNANGYRLPTEAEWEYAARDRGKKRQYAWGNRLPNAHNANWSGSGSYNDGYPNAAPVGTFPKHNRNKIKLYDMTGNLWEWCWDGYERYPDDKIKDYAGVKNAEFKVLRGGAWNYGYLGALRVTFRMFSPPKFRTESSFGFRLCRSVFN